MLANGEFFSSNIKLDTPSTTGKKKARKLVTVASPLVFDLNKDLPGEDQI